jgi:cytochrome c oxidase subunit 2
MHVSSNPDHTITVTAVQWSWQFTYDTDGGPDATTTGTPAKPPTLYLPEGESVLFKLQSDDVIHSFWVPAFLFKMDVIPGRHNHFSLTPTRKGTFDGRCAELCGTYHSRMLFTVKVVSESDYAAHLRKLKQEGNVGPALGASGVNKIAGEHGNSSEEGQ